ncbi:MAG: methylaspartate mutase subunit E [Deltaproteobacteria bacterium]|nr:methylaspartate mutase subunit E [Deltaproteobacteria bacterium]
MELKNARWSDEEFYRERKKVLSMWPTGREIDLDEAIAFHKSLPPERNYVNVVKKAKSEGKTLIQPRGGVALIDEHIKLLKCLQDEGGADLLPTTTDTYTRNMKLDQAQFGIDTSRDAGRSMLNGLPVINHGVKEVRKVVESVDRPIILLSGTPFPQLTAEMAIAAGCSAFLGGGISYTVSYIKDIPISEGIKNYQYLDRLASYYAENGVMLHREQPGFLTGTLIPPGIGIAIGVMEALLAAGQGLRYYSIGLTQNLDIVQDVAALNIMEDVCQEYLKRCGYEDMFISIATHEWMQAFPPDEAKASSVIAMGGIIAALAGATQVITKTTEEFEGIPTKEANAAGLRATKIAIQMIGDRRLPIDDNVRQEMEIIRMEACSILDKTLELGDGDIAIGAVRGFEAGVIDVPWAPNRHARGAVIPVRDAKRAVRYLEFGDLPFSGEVKEYNREKLKEREAKENKKVDYETAIFDVSEISQFC